MARVRRIVAVFAVSAIALSGCQTTGSDQPSGAAAGAAVGAASGAGAATGTAIAGGGFSGQNILVGVLVGAVVGAIAGGAFWASLDKADRLRAEDAARQSANASIRGPVHWQSETNKDVFGWAERASPPVLDGGNLCKQVKSYYYLNDRERTGTQRFCLQDERWVSN
ncbi:hypothetical protein [Thalassobaculum sp.]|uniref:hypothetical protein n=1 Tax=Thalassobaculum sp. TaxID=2022740 RepID=UPI0032ED14ED